MMMMPLRSIWIKFKILIILVTILQERVKIKEFKGTVTYLPYLVQIQDNLNQIETITNWLIKALMRQSRWYQVNKIMMIIVIWILIKNIGRIRSITIIPTWLRDNLILKSLFKILKILLKIKNLKNFKYWNRNKLNFLKSIKIIEVDN